MLINNSFELVDLNNAKVVCMVKLEWNRRNSLIFIGINYCYNLLTKMWAFIFTKHNN